MQESRDKEGKIKESKIKESKIKESKKERLPARLGVRMPFLLEGDFIGGRMEGKR